MELDELSPTNRYRLLSVLGGKCRVCPINEIKHLEIDHIYDDGAEERTKYGSTEKIYGWYLEHSNQAFRRLQPLCKEHHEEKHHPVLTCEMLRENQNPPRIQIFMDILRRLEGSIKKPVEEKVFVQELEKIEEFTNENIRNYIRRMLREASIYESLPGCYNRV